MFSSVFRSLVIFLLFLQHFGMTILTNNNNSSTTNKIHPINILYFHITTNVNQTQVDHLLKTYKGVRNMHHRPFRLIPFFTLGNIVATAMNATLIITSKVNSSSLSHPTMYIGAKAIDEPDKTPLYLWENFVTRSNQRPEFICNDAFPYNLAYCDVKKFAKQSVFDMTIFTDPFDTYTWIALATSFIIVTFIISCYPNGSPFLFLTAIFPTFSALFSAFTGPSSINGKLERSLVFTFWLIFSTIFMNFYTGIMTSTFIRPPPTEILGSVDDLLCNKYTLIFSSKATLLSTKVLAEHQNISALLKLIQTARVSQDHIGELAYGHRIALVYYWTVVFEAVTTADELIRNSNKNNKDQRQDRKCFVGTKLIDSGKLFYAFLPPDSGKVVRVFRKIYDTGIYRLWQKEYIGMSHSKRVQDRVKFISQTKVWFEENTEEQSLRLDGKMTNVFVLYGVCVSFSVFAFICEILEDRFSTKDLVVYF